ncbi:hypothetical protein J2Y39_004130 [Pseudomonas sp. 2957]|uniref:Transmembrane protein n=1 Tax=Pseudomonas fluorescens TaxID=294 RepID=A0A5E7MYW4_PSEFL|nr:hypothetical protein [Pseudomonas sp. 2957]VVP29819.1 hypothetical protein PS847_04277 [Pseudomonas fluorescens]
MHITIITFSGLVLLALMLYIGDPHWLQPPDHGLPLRSAMACDDPDQWRSRRSSCGRPLGTEIALGSAVFGMPAAAMVLFMLLSAES